MQKGNAVVPSILPKDKGNVQLLLPSDYNKYNALVLIAFDPFKKELYKWIWKINSNEQLLNGILTMNDSSTSLLETDTTYTPTDTIAYQQTKSI